MQPRFLAGIAIVLAGACHARNAEHAGWKPTSSPTIAAPAAGAGAGAAPAPEANAPGLSTPDWADIAATYASWVRVDSMNHWAPELCSLQPGKGRVSESDDARTHGGKLYYLYAKDRAAYVTRIDDAQPVGQVIVKESFRAVEVGAGELVDATGMHSSGHLVAHKDGKTWRPGEAIGLFVMAKIAADGEGTDRGWIYATTSLDGKVVHEHGRVASCMKCHAEAPHDRLFGLTP